jgi:hypothetical protein
MEVLVILSLSSLDSKLGDSLWRSLVALLCWWMLVDAPLVMECWSYSRSPRFMLSSLMRLSTCSAKGLFKVEGGFYC